MIPECEEANCNSPLQPQGSFLIRHCHLSEKRWLICRKPRTGVGSSYIVIITGDKNKDMDIEHFFRAFEDDGQEAEEVYDTMRRALSDS